MRRQFPDQAKPASRPRGVPLRSPLLAGLLAFASSGCSLLFIKGPSDTSHSQFRPGSSVKCTSSKVAPALDTVFAGLEVLRTGLAAGADDSVYNNPNQPLSREADIALGIGFASLFLGSAIYGYATTAACSKRKQANAPDVQEPENPGDSPRDPAAPPMRPWQSNLTPVPSR